VGDVLDAQGNFVAALNALQTGLEISEHLAKADPSNAGWQTKLAISLYITANFFSKQGREEDAFSYLNRCWQVLRMMKEKDMEYDPLLVKILKVLDAYFLKTEKNISTPLVKVPSPHPNADPEKAASLNIQYQEALRVWKSLPWWKRLRTAKPEPPGNI
jgi:hypothetical protein